MKFFAWGLLACFLCAAVSPVFGKGSIDLVALKKQEEERRKKISKSRQAVTDTNVNRFSSGGKPYGFVQMESDTPPPAEGQLNPPAGTSAASPADMEKQPDFWKKQQVELATRIAELKEGITVAQLELNRLWSDFYIKNIPAEQDAIKVQITQLTNQLEQKKLFLSQSETQLEEFIEKARKAGIPPGWLR